MTGMLARNSVNPNFATNMSKYVTDSCFQPLVLEQIKAVLITIVLSVVGTVIIAYVTKLLVGLRPTEEVEVTGLDESEHGELGYHDA